MCTYLDKKCFGITSIVAAILLGLIAFGVWSSVLNLTLFFAIMLLAVGIHALGCKCDSECCEMPKEKPGKKK